MTRAVSDFFVNIFTNTSESAPFEMAPRPARVTAGVLTESYPKVARLASFAKVPGPSGDQKLNRPENLFQHISRFVPGPIGNARKLRLNGLCWVFERTTRPVRVLAGGLLGGSASPEPRSAAEARRSEGATMERISCLCVLRFWICVHLRLTIRVNLCSSVVDSISPKRKWARPR